MNRDKWGCEFAIVEMMQKKLKVNNGLTCYVSSAWILWLSMIGWSCAGGMKSTVAPYQQENIRVDLLCDVPLELPKSWSYFEPSYHIVGARANEFDIWKTNPLSGTSVVIHRFSCAKGLMSVDTLEIFPSANEGDSHAARSLMRVSEKNGVYALLYSDAVAVVEWNGVGWGVPRYRELQMPGQNIWVTDSLIYVTNTYALLLDADSPWATIQRFYAKDLKSLKTLEMTVSGLSLTLFLPRDIIAIDTRWIVIANADDYTLRVLSLREGEAEIKETRWLERSYAWSIGSADSIFRKMRNAGSAAKQIIDSLRPIAYERPAVSRVGFLNENVLLVSWSTGKKERYGSDVEFRHFIHDLWQIDSTGDAHLLRRFRDRYPSDSDVVGEGSSLRISDKWVIFEDRVAVLDTRRLIGSVGSTWGEARQTAQEMAFSGDSGATIFIVSFDDKD